MILPGVEGLLTTAFSQRFEEVLASEIVHEVSTDSRRNNSKSRCLVLCRPFGNATGNCTLNVASVDEEKQGVKIKRTFFLERLIDITHDGSFDATFNFGTSGTISVSFESYIQREMYISTLKKLQREAQGSGVRSGNVRDVRTYLSEAVGAETEADVASRVKKLRKEKRRIFSSEDEKELLRCIGRLSFDDIRGLQQSVSSSQKNSELFSLDTLVKSANEWEEMRTQVTHMISDVEEMEKRIEDYSSHLLSKKDILQRIEHDNNTLQRKQKNLDELFKAMNDIANRLSLPQNTIPLLSSLQDVKQERLVSFFSEGSNASRLSSVMKQMEEVLQNTQLEVDYPIAAITERKKFFLSQRKLIANRSKMYIFSIIEEYEKKYLDDSSRFSSCDRLVLQMHLDLMKKLEEMSDMIKALSRIELEGFTAILRKYRTSMQGVYALELHKFFKCVRRQVKKVGWRGPFSLGVADTPDQAITNRMESAVAGETPSPKGVYTPFGSSGLKVYSENAEALDEQSDDSKMLVIEIPTSQVPGIELYNSASVLYHLGIRPTSHSILSTLTSHGVGGDLRPDLAFGIVLKSIVALILKEEYILNTCFGISESKVKKRGVTASGSFSAEEIPADDHSEISEGLKNDLEGRNQPFDILESDSLQFTESLLELFGGEVKAIFSTTNSTRENSLGGKSTSRKNSSLSRVAGGVSERGKSQAPSFHSILSKNFVVCEVVDFVKFLCEKSDRIYSIPMISMVKAYLCGSMRPSSSSFCVYILERVQEVLNSSLSRFVAEQTASINHCKNKYLVRPTALLHCFSKLPAFIQRMDAVHSILSPICDRAEYSAILTSFVEQAFEVLDHVTNIRGDSAEVNIRDSLKLSEKVAQTFHFIVEGRKADINSLKQSFIQQYRHQAFFCALVSSLSPQSHTFELLSERFESSKLKRDRYEELYLTRILLEVEFPVMGNFVSTAEDLARIYSKAELTNHRSMIPEAVGRVIQQMAKEIRDGIYSVSKRIKRHFLNDVDLNSPEMSFHQALLQQTWNHFKKLLLQKINFIRGLLNFPVYKGIEFQITQSEVIELLDSF